MEELAECEGTLRTMLKWAPEPQMHIHVKQARAFADAFADAQRHIAKDLFDEASNLRGASMVRDKYE